MSQDKATHKPHYEASGKRVRTKVQDATSRASAWFEGIAPGNGNALLFGVIGAIVAIVLLIIGFWAAFVIALLTVIGVMFGQWLDGNPALWNSIKHFFRGQD